VIFKHPKAAIGWLLVTALFAGCGEPNRLGRVPVTGTVNLAGKPLDFGSISFNPKASGSVNSGAVIVDGTYSIPEQKGLPKGEYVVRIHATTAASGQQAEDATLTAAVGLERVPEKYNVKSKIVVTVGDKSPAVFDFDIKP